MVIVFVSNYLNHHQIPFCESMCRNSGAKDSFFFIQTMEMEEERVAMGWKMDLEEYPFAKCYYKCEVQCQELIDFADVVLFGGVEDERYIEKRLNENRLVIRISERIYKEGQWKFVSPRGLRKKYHDHIRYRKKNVYLLCSGAYVASDFSLIHAYPDKMYKWGYFPEFINYTNEELFDKKSNEGPIKILWTARMISLKHPEHAIMAAAQLKKMSIPFKLTMAGGGELEEDMKKLAERLGLADSVSFEGFMKPSEVRMLMRESDIFIFTSNHIEGWGAVLNESMNSGCAVIAPSCVGAVPYLIKHEKNGMVYKAGNVNELSDYMRNLACNRAKCRELGKNAYDTIKTDWNAETAAGNLLKLIDAIVNKKQCIINEGPGSKAPVISPHEGYKYTRK